jgi:hypothetical protein
VKKIELGENAFNFQTFHEKPRKINKMNAVQTIEKRGSWEYFVLHYYGTPAKEM